MIESKHEKLKKSSKESDSKNLKTITELEKETAIQKEKILNLEARLADSENKYNNEISSYTNQINNLREAYDNERKPLISEIEKFRAITSQLENEKAELIASYEKDKALWEGKFTFLEQQKEQAKADLSENLKKFESTLHHLQKARSSEKNEQESNLSEMCLEMEKKYQSQINSLNENHNR